MSHPSKRSVILLSIIALAMLAPIGGTVSGQVNSYTYIAPLANRGYFSIVKYVLDNAKVSIHAALMYITDPSSSADIQALCDALINAKNRGVDVKVVLESDYQSTSQAAYDYLISAGVNVIWDTGKFIHAKMLVIDGQTVILGSTNCCNYAQNYNNEVSVLINDTSVAGYYEQYFNAVWNGVDDPGLGIQEFNNISCAYDSYTYDLIRNAILNAQTKIYIAIYRMYYEDPVTTLLQDLVDAKNRGVDVRVILEDNTYANGDAYDYLSSNGVSVKWDSSDILTHDKLIVVDDTVIVGDTNWGSYYLTGLDYTVSAHIKYAKIAAYYEDYFLQFWNSGDPAVEPYYLPHVFTPMPYVEVYGAESLDIPLVIVNGGEYGDSYAITAVDQVGWTLSVTPTSVYLSSDSSTTGSLSFTSTSSDPSNVIRVDVASGSYSSAVGTAYIKVVNVALVPEYSDTLLALSFLTAVALTVVIVRRN